jgi:hypothetical protein
MVSASSFSIHRPAQSKAAARTARGVTEFLGAHDKLGALLPAVTRMAQLQKDCAKTLPTMFDACDVLQFADGQLVLAVPNTALAAKLKQQLPKLRESLCKLGWQVNAVRLKVQATRPVAPQPPPRSLELSPTALPALAQLDDQLENSPRNAALKAAIETMLRRHRRPPG